MTAREKNGQIKAGNHNIEEVVVPSRIGRWMYRQTHTARQVQTLRWRKKVASGRVKPKQQASQNGFVAAMMRSLGLA